MDNDSNVIDFLLVLEKRQIEQAREFLAVTPEQTLADLERIEALLHEERLRGDDDIRLVVSYLGQVMNMGLHGQRARMRAAVLLRELAHARSSALSDEAREVVDRAAVGIRAFNAVTSGILTPTDMNDLINEKEYEDAERYNTAMESGGDGDQ